MNLNVMKSDVTRVIKQITLMSLCDIFEFYAYYKRLKIKITIGTGLSSPS